MNQFRVVIIAPENNPHVAAFTELAIALVTGIRENGYSCDIALNEINPSAVNIILGFHLLKESDIPAGIRYIVYQLEQLSDTEGWLLHHPNMLSVMKNAEAVWDFSPENVLFLNEKGINAKHIPVGYSEALKKIPATSKDIDILFYGSRNDRRGKVLEELVRRGLNVKALFGLYGEERDSWISRAKMVINIHFYEASLFESVRLSYLVNNSVAVLTEESPSYPWSEVPLEQVSYDKLADRAEEMIHQWDLEEYGRNCAEKYGAFYGMKELVAPLLNE